jgi:hypothetical protein
MRDLSLKGIARKYAGITSGFSVVGDIFGVSSITGTSSLRSKLEDMAREEHSFGMSECIFGWTAAFRQTWTHIRIRIRLNPDAGIPAATMTNLRTAWRTGIVNTWSDQWGCGHSGELSCPLTFEVEWVNTGQHHTVRVQPGPAETVMTTWDTADGGGTAAHEYGHMLGLVDEYTDARCPGRSPVNTGTVMHNNSANVPSRMMTRFASNIGSSVVAI